MNPLDLIAVLLVTALLVYLLVALLKPELFS